MFYTPRLCLRAFNGPKDAETLLSLINNALVAPLFMSRPIVPRPSKFKDDITKWAEDSIMYCIIEELDGNEFVGMIAFTNANSPDSRNREGVLGVGIKPEFWNKGYGREAIAFFIDYGFRALAFHRVSLTVYEGNDRAIALYKNLGFVEEGRLRKALWSNGSWKDIICMGILEEEWKKSEK